ncbi:MAG: hypothetical protein ACP5K2_01885 [bacterium]
MEKKQKLQIIEEIKKIERELYLKKTQLAVLEALEYEVTRPSLLAEGLNPQEWKKVFSELITLIGQQSSGGNSIEDIKIERER